jgi:hypothetical protein
MATKVVIMNANLRGSGDERFPQRVASGLRGRSRIQCYGSVGRDWRCSGMVEAAEVYQLTPHRKNLVTDGRSSSIIQKVADELERRKLDAEI